MNTDSDAANQLKALGIALKSTSLLEDAYSQLSAMPMLPLTTSMQLLVIDLNNLPTRPIPFKEIFIRWMLQVNEGRLINGDEPLLSYNLAKRCPIWKLIKMPVRSMTMVRDKVIQAPKLKLKTVRQQQTPKGIR